MNYANRIKELRCSRGLSQKQLAEGTCLTVTAIQNYEYGTRQPAFDALIALADFFGVSLDYLVGRSDDPNLH